MSLKPFPDNATNGDRYHPAMKITDQKEADAYFELCVEWQMRHGYSRAEAEKIERGNLVYFAGYYNAETVARVERLFGGVYPGFGNILVYRASDLTGTGSTPAA